MIDLEKFKKLFQERKIKVSNLINSTDPSIDGAGDEIDEASAGVLGSVTMNLSKRYIKEMRNIDKALGRIESGTFGECKECEEEIGEKRLIAKPDAINCISCAEKLESLARQFGITC